MRNIRHCKILRYIGFCTLCTLINVDASWLANHFGLPMYLDAIGTVLAAVYAGCVPAMAVGMATNIIRSILADPSSIYYGFINILIAILSAHFLFGKSRIRTKNVLVLILALAALGALVGGTMNWYLYGPYTEAELPGLAAGIPYVHNTYLKLIISDIIKELMDKTVSVLFVLGMTKIWKPKQKIKKEKTRRSIHSLGFKVAMVISIPTILLAVFAVGISTKMFLDTTLANHTKIAEGATRMMQNVLDEKSMAKYAKGDMKGYEQEKDKLESIRSNYPDLTYMYVYRIKEDGCHVIFDLDTETTKGAGYGEIIPFDDSFSDKLPLLLEGMPIDPIITDDTFGWLLTVYTPMYNSEGDCICYTAVDISMDTLRTTIISHGLKMLSIFMNAFLWLLAALLLFMYKNVIRPVNSIAEASENFVSEKKKRKKLNAHAFDNIDIHTNDEIESLYHACKTMANDCVQYVRQIKDQAGKLQQMQDGLIMVLADVVESRDKYTGDHVKNTSAYVKILVEQMKKDGVYKDMLTDEYVANVIHSAPLHDVGKIRIPDAILNKPARLTNEEFDIMKHHTDEGNNIIESAVEIVPDPIYLQETLNMAEYHHEKWDGTGYPCGLKGEEIPLSARIMAVADVYDALVSKRSYKEGFPPDKAFAIIEEGAGTHFDPQIAESFLRCRDRIESVQ